MRRRTAEVRVLVLWKRRWSTPSSASRRGSPADSEVLDVERNLLAAELALAESERARKAALTDLVKALGGGWAGGDGAQPPEPR